MIDMIRWIYLEVYKVFLIRYGEIRNWINLENEQLYLYYCYCWLLLCMHQQRGKMRKRNNTGICEFGS